MEHAVFKIFKTNEHFTEPFWIFCISVSACHNGFSEIRVDYKHLLSKLRKTFCNMQRHCGFTLVFAAARKSSSCFGQVNIGTKDFVCFLRKKVAVARQPELYRFHILSSFLPFVLFLLS